MYTPKNIIIRVDSSTQMGAGHTMRCLAFAQGCQGLGGKVYFLGASQIPDLVSRIGQENCRYWQLACQPGTKEDAIQTADYAKKMGVNWIVVDGYHFTTPFFEYLKEAGLKTFLISDFAAPDLEVDMILNQNLWAKKEAYPYCTKQFLGVEYLLLRKEFFAYQQWQKIPHQGSLRVMVTLGGTDPKNVTARIIDILEKIKESELIVSLILGSGNTYLENIAMLIQQTSQHQYHLHHNISDMAKEMAQTDLAITAAGSTCWELAFMKVPALMLIVAQNQELVAKSMDEYGLGVSLGWVDPGFEERLALTLQTLLANPAKLRDFTDKAESLSFASKTSTIYQSLIESL
jgi:UDP-2,4-diacetamido-2,4,6-trideoxy-beta-L-altropyranose hydrolase